MTEPKKAAPPKAASRKAANPRTKAATPPPGPVGTDVPRGEGLVIDLLWTAPDPDSIALIDRSRPRPLQLTNAEFRDAVARFASGLVAWGIKSGDRVGILSDNRAEYLVAFFATMMAGGAVVPLNTKLPEETQRYISADADLKLVFADSVNRTKTPRNVAPVWIGQEIWTEMAAAAPLEGRGLAKPEDVALHIYTSGSTGRPKGVILTQHAVWWTCTKYGFTESGEVMLVSAPLYHKNALMASKLSFTAGGTTVLLPRFTPNGYLDAIEQNRVTMCSGIPTMYALVAAELSSGRRRDLSSVKRVLIGSAPLTEALFDKVASLFPTALVTNGYGTTEAVLEFGPHPDGLQRPKISLGYAHPDVELRLIDPETGGDDDHGELAVRSPGVMRGYHNLQAVTSQRLVDGWYLTGDLMRRDENGWYFFMGRVDDMFVCAGENIYPDAVEQLLERHPSVHQAVVVPIDDELKMYVPAAFVRTVPGAQLSVEAVKQWALDGGPAYAHPRHVWFVDEIPLASTNKIDRTALIAEAARRVSAERAASSNG